MSYHVYLFAKQTRVDNESSPSTEWLEDRSRLTVFSPDERAALVARLESSGFSLASTDGVAQRFENEALGASALLDDRGLYLSASGMDGSFEIGMLASEVAHDGETFAKLEPQYGSWEPEST